MDPSLPPSQITHSAGATQATGFRRWLYIALGLFFVGCGYLGILLPGVPTTPFLLAASFFFLRSSPRLYRWLRRSPVFGRLLHDWEVHRGIRRPIKIFAIGLVVVVVSCSITFTSLPIWVKCLIGGLALIGVLTIWFVPTARIPSENAAWGSTNEAGSSSDSNAEGNVFGRQAESSHDR